MPRRSDAVTSVDVARAAGVSQTTVSRVLNGHPLVSEQARTRVHAAIDRLGYRPNLTARSLVTHRTRTVGIVVGALTNGYYAELLDILGAQLRQAGYRTVIVSDAGDADDLALTLSRNSVDGFVVATTLLSPADHARLARLGVPWVTMTSEAGTDSVAADQVAGGRLAGEHLVGLGHRRIGVIAGPLSASSVGARHRGFVAACTAGGVPFDDALLAVGDLEYDRAYEAATALLGRRDRPTALFCHNDLMAFAALNAAAAAGLRVPADVSVLGFDDVRMASWESFALTTVHQPIQELAHRAADLLLDRFADPSQAAVRLVLPCTLRERSTTGPAAARPRRGRAQPPRPRASGATGA